MRNVRHPALLALMVLISALTWAGEPQPATEPTKSMADLVDFFNGEWQCAGQFSSGKKITSTESFESLLGGVWLQQVHHDDPRFGYHAYSMWGVDRDSGHLLVTIYDVTGGKRMFSSPTYAAPTIILSILPGPESKTVTERFIYERKSTTAFSFEYQTPNASGAWAMVDHLECRRGP